jgi:hypothetical protein
MILEKLILEKKCLLNEVTMINDNDISNTSITCSPYGDSYSISSPTCYRSNSVLSNEIDGPLSLERLDHDLSCVGFSASLWQQFQTGPGILD